MFVNYWQVRSVVKYLKLCTYNNTNAWFLHLHKPSQVKLTMQDKNICDYLLCQHLVAAILVKDFDLCANFCNSHPTHWGVGWPCALAYCHLALKRINFSFSQTHWHCCLFISLQLAISVTFQMLFASHFTFDSSAVVICYCKPNASTKEDTSISLFA